MECESLRVEADTWYSLGKCLLNAFSKLGADYLVGTSVKILPVKKERQTSTASNQGALTISNLITQPEEPEDTQSNADSKSTKRRRSTSEADVDSKRRLSKRVRALEETVTEGNARTQDFIQSLNNLLLPFNIEFGDYSTMEFFKTNTESSDRALDVWKNFLWEWTTERALPFETTHKHKYILG
jgi:hypothetical protein